MKSTKRSLCCNYRFTSFIKCFISKCTVWISLTLNNHDQRHPERIVCGNTQIILFQITSAFNTSSTRCITSNVFLSSMGYQSRKPTRVPPLTPQHQTPYCTGLLTINQTLQDWQHVAWSDSSYFGLVVGFWYAMNPIYLEGTIQAGDDSIMKLNVFTWHKLGPLFFINIPLTTLFYCFMTICSHSQIPCTLKVMGYFNRVITPSHCT